MQLQQTYIFWSTWKHMMMHCHVSWCKALQKIVPCLFFRRLDALPAYAFEWAALTQAKMCIGTRVLTQCTRTPRSEYSLLIWVLVSHSSIIHPIFWIIDSFQWFIFYLLWTEIQASNRTTNNWQRGNTKPSDGPPFCNNPNFSTDSQRPHYLSCCCENYTPTHSQ